MAMSPFSHGLLDIIHNILCKYDPLDRQPERYQFAASELLASAMMWAPGCFDNDADEHFAEAYEELREDVITVLSYSGEKVFDITYDILRRGHDLCELLDEDEIDIRPAQAAERDDGELPHNVFSIKGGIRRERLN